MARWMQLSVASIFGAFVMWHLGDRWKHARLLLMACDAQKASAPAQLVDVQIEQPPRSLGATHGACNGAALQRVLHGLGWS